MVKRCGQKLNKSNTPVAYFTNIELMLFMYIWLGFWKHRYYWFGSSNPYFGPLHSAITHKVVTFQQSRIYDKICTKQRRACLMKYHSTSKLTMIHGGYPHPKFHHTHSWARL